MSKSLLAWIGNTDLKAAAGEEAIGLGPIAQAVVVRDFKYVVLLNNYGDRPGRKYKRWLAGRTEASISVVEQKLSSPVDFGEIYAAARRVVDAQLSAGDSNTKLVFHLSPGTPAMAAVWIILAKAFYDAELIQSSREGGVVTASIPFDISAEFIPDLLRHKDQAIEHLVAGLPPEAPEFDDIVHRCPEMKRVIAKARRVAVHSVPVLIEGESGTGKELLARAIHDASPRKAKPFVAINCGAIPANLVESEIFGHIKGAFSGAVADRKGLFRTASGGTVFLDEIGELPAEAQVKLLRTLETGEIVPVGSSKIYKPDVRLLTATNRNLIEEVSAGRFREDLFYRLAVAVLNLPPLRARKGDLSLLIDRMLEQVGRELPETGNKKLSAGARKLMLQHSWPGNVRELLNTLRRAAIWSARATIDADEIREAILTDRPVSGEQVLGAALGKGFNLNETLGLVARHYLKRALDESGGNKTMTAQLLGLPSYQTLSNWLKKYGVEE
jgi:transcriptional regulator with PAS, ATPase and Fis domain